MTHSLRSRRLEVVGTRKNGRGRRRLPRVSPSRAPVLSFAHYFQAPATQARCRTSTGSGLAKFLGKRKGLTKKGGPRNDSTGDRADCKHRCCKALFPKVTVSLQEKQDPPHLLFKVPGGSCALAITHLTIGLSAK